MNSEKIKFGVVGTHMGRSHMTGIINAGAELTAICDIIPEAAEKCRAEFGLKRYYTDFTEMLNCEKLDAVVIATPDQVHREQTVAALKKGIHVLCEKPMALKTDDCRAMIEASKESGKLLMIGQVCRKAPGFAAAKKLIEDGEIGELFYVESEYAHDYARIPGMGGWRTDPVNLRHPVIGGGCHAIDLLRWIAGNPTEVFAYANHKMLKSWPVDDCTVAVMKFPCDVIGKVFTSVGCKREYTMRTVLYGSKGTIITDNTSDHIVIQRELQNEAGTFVIKSENIPVNINNHNVTSEIQELCDAIKNDLPVETDGAEGGSTVAVGCAIVESAATGLPVRPDYRF